jgi:hypothetical protein
MQSSHRRAFEAALTFGSFVSRQRSEEKKIKMNVLVNHVRKCMYPCPFDKLRDRTSTSSGIEMGR